MAVSQLIRKLRKKMNYSQNDLAKKIGVNKTEISDWECGRKEPQGKSLLKIMKECKAVSAQPETEKCPLCGKEIIKETSDV